MNLLENARVDFSGAERCTERERGRDAGEAGQAGAADPLARLERPNTHPPRTSPGAPGQGLEPNL